MCKPIDPLNITPAVAKGSVADLMGRFANNYIWSHNEAATKMVFDEKTKKEEPVEISIDELFEVEKVYLESGCMVPTAAINIRDFLSKPVKFVGNQFFFYRDENEKTPLVYCILNNPIASGVNAIKLKKKRGSPIHRIFVTSGKLGGCAFGVLRDKEDN